MNPRQASPSPANALLPVTFQNARSLKTQTAKSPKLQALWAELASDSTACLAFVESWLDDSVTDGYLMGESISDYSVYRRDRGAKGGGIVLFLRNSVCMSREVPLGLRKGEGPELLAVDLLSMPAPTRVFLWYRPPSSGDAAATELYLRLSLQAIESHLPAHGHIMLLCDANFPDVCWEKSQAKSFLGRLFLEFCARVGLRLCTPGPTRGGAWLDLVMSTQPRLVTHSRVHQSAFASDHDAISFTIHLPTHSPPPRLTPQPYRAFHMADLPSMRSFIKLHDWAAIRRTSACIEDFLEAIRNCLWEACDRYVPLRQPRANRSHLPPALIRLRKKRFRLLRHRKRSPEAQLAFTECDANYRAALRSHLPALEKKLSDKSPASLFRYLRGVKADPPSNVLMASGIPIATPALRAELFAATFANVYLTHSSPVPSVPPRTDARLSSVCLSLPKVRCSLAKLKGKLSRAKDEFPPRLVKDLFEELALPLSLLYQWSLRAGVLPAQFAPLTVIPIWKRKGDRSDPKMYRPISLGPALLKGMETIISKALTHFVTANNLLSPRQFGFQKGKSITGQMIGCHNIWSKALFEGEVVDCVYTDFSRAYDVIDHGLLLGRLASYGISGPLLTWLEAYLTQRSFQVSIPPSYSSTRPIGSGISQGSSLSCLLFICWLDPLIRAIDIEGVSIFAFADDVKALSKDPAKLQESLDIFGTWTTDSAMPLSRGKSFVYQIGAPTPPTHHPPIAWRASRSPSTKAVPSET